MGVCLFSFFGPDDPTAAPYRFYLLKRVQNDDAAMNAGDWQAVDALLEACAMTPILGATLTCDIGRKDNLEIWL